MTKESVLECQICLEEFPNDNYFLFFPCNHNFCYLCCLEMFYQQQGHKCPVCRKYLTANLLVQLPEDDLWVIQQVKHMKPTLGQKIVLTHLQKRFATLKNHDTLSSYHLVFEKIKMLLVIGTPRQKIRILNFMEKMDRQIDFVKEKIFWDSYYALLHEVITLLPGLRMDTKLKILSWGEDNVTISCCRYNLLLNYLIDNYNYYDFGNLKDDKISDDKYYQKFIDECLIIYKLHRYNNWQLNNVSIDDVIFYLIKYYQKYYHPGLLPILTERVNFYANQNIFLNPTQEIEHFAYILSIAIFYLYSPFKFKKWDQKFQFLEEYIPDKYYLDLSTKYLNMAEDLTLDNLDLKKKLIEDSENWYQIYYNCRGIIEYYQGNYQLSIKYLLEYESEYAFLALSYYHLNDILTAKYYYQKYCDMFISLKSIFQHQLLDVYIEDFFGQSSFHRVLYDRKDLLREYIYPSIFKPIINIGNSKYFMKYYVLFYICVQLYISKGDGLDIFWICLVGILVWICWNPKVKDTKYFVSNLLGGWFPQYKYK